MMVWVKKSYQNFLYHIEKWNKQVITFSDIEIKNCKFRYSKYPININNVDIVKIIISKKIFLGKKCLKYFIGYKK